MSVPEQVPSNSPRALLRLTRCGTRRRAGCASTGCPAEEVAQQLGHRKLGTTGVYTEYDPEYLKAACEALDGLLQAVLAKSLPDDPRTNREKSGKSTVSCRSSVVEHSLGKGEVVCSIHTGSTTHIRGT